MSIAIIINNYLHDVASAVLVVSAVIVLALDRAVSRESSADRYSLLRAAYPVLVRLAWLSIAWIVIGGIPRTIFFTRFEWDPAVARGIVPALVIKHVLMFAGVLVGGIMWLRIGRRLRAGDAS